MFGHLTTEWTICVLYMLTAWVIYRYRVQGIPPQDHNLNELMMWRVVTVVLVAFGINKVADLQTLLLQALKAIAGAMQIGEAKFVLKIALLLVIVTCGCAAAYWLFQRFWQPLQRNVHLVLGGSCLAGYYLLRASNFLGFLEFAATNSWCLEVLGLVILSLSTLLSVRRRPTAAPTNIKKQY